MIVCCLGLIFSVRTFLQPFREFGEPEFHALPIGVRPCRRAGEQSHGIHCASKAARLDDTDAAALVDPRNVLPEIEVRIHARGGVEEPGAKQERGASGVTLVVSEVPGQREGLRIARHAIHVGVVGDAIDLGVALAVFNGCMADHRVWPGRATSRALGSGSRAYRRWAERATSGRRNRVRGPSLYRRQRVRPRPALDRHGVPAEFGVENEDTGDIGGRQTSSREHGKEQRPTHDY